MNKKNLEHSIIQSELYFIEFTMASFKNYFDVIETNLQNHHIDILKEYHKITRKLQDEKYDGEDLGHIYDSASQALNEVEQGFFQRFRYSMIIQLYSFIETELTNFCDIHYNENQKEYKLKDLRGENELDKIKKYLTNSANINLGENPLWPFINDLRKLRNCIVHSNGMIEKKSNDFKSIEKFSKNNFNLKDGSEESYLITIDYSKFIRLCIDNVEVFLVSIMK